MKVAATIAALALLAGCTSSEPVPTARPGEATPTPATRSTPAPEPVWDPRDVDDLPAAAPTVLTALPRRVEPPAHATPLAESPMAAAVLAVDRRGRRLQLLAPDGSWREVRPAERYARESLSPDGTRLAALLSDRIELWHLPTGERTEIPLPDRFRPWDYSNVGWLDATTLLLDDYAGGWRVDTASGAAVRTPYPRRFSWSADRDGVVVESTDPSRPPVLVDWAGGTPRRIDLTRREMPVGVPIRIVVSPDLVAGTVYGDGDFAAFALDRARPDEVDTLPVLDFEGNYSNWALQTVHVLADGTVLLWVAIPGPSRKDGWRLVRWDPGTDRLEVVTTSESDPTWTIGLAGGLLDRR